MNNQPASTETSASSKTQVATTEPVGGVEVAPQVYLPAKALRFSYKRSSGPGGQNVNKVATKARLEIFFEPLEVALGKIFFRRLLKIAGPSHTADAGYLFIVCEVWRSQRANRQACMEQLRQWIIEAKKPLKKRHLTHPTRGSVQKRLEVKKQRSQKKQKRQQIDASE